MSALTKVRNFVTGDNRFPKKEVRNFAFAGGNCKCHLTEQGAFCKYWDTNVAELVGNVVRLDMGGFPTRSTSEAMNIFLGLFVSNVYVRRIKWVFYLIRREKDGTETRVAELGEGTCGEKEGPTEEFYYNINSNKLVDGFSDQQPKKKRSRRSNDENDADWTPALEKTAGKRRTKTNRSLRLKNAPPRPLVKSGDGFLWQ